MNISQIYIAIYILISIVIAVLAIGVAIALIIATRRSHANRNVTTGGEYPKGYWMSVGISIGIAIGAAMGPIFDNFGVGIGIGIALGTAIGASLEQKNKDKIRPLTVQERKTQKWGITIGLALPIVLAVSLAIVYFLKAR